MGYYGQFSGWIYVPKLLRILAPHQLAVMLEEHMLGMPSLQGRLGRVFVVGQGNRSRSCDAGQSCGHLSIPHLAFTVFSSADHRLLMLLIGSFAPNFIHSTLLSLMSTNLLWRVLVCLPFSPTSRCSIEMFFSPNRLTSDGRMPQKSSAQQASAVQGHPHA